MRKQQQIWENEHRNPEILPTLEYIEPSSGVIYFIAFLKSQGIVPPGKIIDIGCGKGRNTIYLAKLGFNVYGIDYIKYAIDYTRGEAIKQSVSSRVHLYHTEIDKTWPFAKGFFDIAIDCFASIDIESIEGRKTYREELLRTLKPNGYAFVMVVSADDEIEREFIQKFPGKEKNSTVWPKNGKFQKDYDEKELRDFYSDFAIIEIREVKKRAFKLGRNYTATNYWIILKKQ